MKTALQELIAWCEEIELSKEYAQSPRLKTGISMAKIKATELLEKEKKQIVNAFHYGQEGIIKAINKSIPLPKLMAEIYSVEKGLIPNKEAEDYYKSRKCSNFR